MNVSLTQTSLSNFSTRLYNGVANPAGTINKLKFLTDNNKFLAIKNRSLTLRSNSQQFLKQIQIPIETESFVRAPSVLFSLTKTLQKENLVQLYTFQVNMISSLRGVDTPIV